MRKVLPLIGYKSLRAFNAFNALLLGMKMLPAYMGQSWEEFLSSVEALPEEDQRRIITEGARFVELSEEEVKAIVGFSTDPNGVPYGAENIKSLGPKDLVEVIVEVCLEIGKIKIDFVSENEKKN